MRDPRFVAMHRGGLLEIERHRLLAAWAARCAEHVLPIFDAALSDDGPRHAVEIAKAWAKGEVTVGEARRAASAAHESARRAATAVDEAVARAAGHAAATAHMADHCIRASCYALRAVAATGSQTVAERAWQHAQLPRQIEDLVLNGADAVTR